MLRRASSKTPESLVRRVSFSPEVSVRVMEKPDQDVVAFLKKHEHEDAAVLERMLADFLAGRSAKSAGKGKGTHGKGKGQASPPALCDASRPRVKRENEEAEPPKRELKRLRHLKTSESTPEEQDSATTKKKKMREEEPEEPVKEKKTKKKDVEESEEPVKEKKTKKKDVEGSEEPVKEKKVKKKDVEEPEEPVKEKKVKKKDVEESEEPVKEKKTKKKDVEEPEEPVKEKKVKKKDLQEPDKPVQKTKVVQPPVEDNELESEEPLTEEEEDVREFMKSIGAPSPPPRRKEPLKGSEGGLRIYDLKAVRRVPKFGGAPYDQPCSAATPTNYKQLTLYDLSTVHVVTAKGTNEGKGESKGAVLAAPEGSKLSCEMFAVFVSEYGWLSGPKSAEKMLGARSPFFFNCES